MRRISVLTIPLVVALVAMLGMASAGLVSAQTSTPMPDHGGHSGTDMATPTPQALSIVGSWQPVATVEGQADQHGLATFGADGTFTGASLPVPANLTSMAGPSHGVWTSTSPTSADLTAIALLTDKEGHVIGSVTYHAHFDVIVSGQAFSGPFDAAIADATGQVTGTFIGTIQAMRINLIPAEIPGVGTPAATPQAS